MSAERPARLRRILVLSVSFVISISLCAGGWAGFLWASGNVHEISSGVYRSAQLNPPHLKELIREKSIRTVINLRGPNPGKPWYDAEVATVEASGARLISLPMSAIREPPEDLLGKLMTVLHEAERPLLIHCESGSDRTGLAAALYELTINGKSAEEANQQLSFRYGHFPWLLSRSGAMDRTFWRVAQ